MNGIMSGITDREDYQDGSTAERLIAAAGERGGMDPLTQFLIQGGLNLAAGPATGNVTDEDIATLSTDALRSKLEEYEAAEKKAIEDSDLSEAEKKKALELIDRNRLVQLAKDKLKKRGLFSGLSRPEQERLAVQETTLVYALANTFKDQDRLTQRDIDAARNIVNIFSLTRSSADVRASIQAIAQQLEADIRRQEELYALSGGLETSVQQLRSLKNFTPFREVEGGVEEQLFKDLTDEDVKKELESVQL